MPFVNSILNYNSLSIVGLEKNTGKTVCLNYILRRLNEMGVQVGVTSIGVDGEQTDSVYSTAKPEIVLYKDTLFITSEQHYLKRQLLSSIESVDSLRTSLGQLVTARVLLPGKVLLSGAATTAVLRKQIQQLHSMGVRLSIVDGALSRLSLASPTVTEAMILATGAAVSHNLQQLVSKTSFLYRLINIPEVDDSIAESINNIESGIWAIDNDGVAHDVGIRSAFMIGDDTDNLFRYGTTLFSAGAVSDRLLKMLAAKGENITLIARDFTKFFISPDVYSAFIRSGNTLAVIRRSKLIALTLNPTSPQGYVLDSKRACGALSDALQIPVYDVKKIDQ